MSHTVLVTVDMEASPGQTMVINHVSDIIWNLPYIISLEWFHMSVMATQIAGKSIVCSKANLVYH